MVAWKDAKETKSWIFHKAATDPSAGVSLTHWLTHRHLPGLCLVRVIRGLRLKVKGLKINTCDSSNALR